MKKLYLTIGIAFAVILSILSVDTSSGIMHSGGVVMLKSIALSFLSPEISVEILKTALDATLITVVYAFAGMSISIVLGFVFGIISSEAIFQSKLRPVSKLFRALLGFMRAIHELIWAWFFVASIGLSPLSGVFALAIPYGGTLGRIYSDMLDDVPKAPVSNLNSGGGSRLQVLFYGYLPSASSSMISYTMYRLECAIRSSAILSFVGLGGIGYQIQMALHDLNFSRAWTYVFVLVLVVTALDAWSNSIRKRLI